MSKLDEEIWAWRNVASTRREAWGVCLPNSGHLLNGRSPWAECLRDASL